MVMFDIRPAAPPCPAGLVLVLYSFGWGIVVGRGKKYYFLITLEGIGGRGSEIAEIDIT